MSNITKQGNIVIGTSTLYKMQIKSLDDGSLWARIHWLDVSSTKEWFTSNDEVSECTNKANRFSMMKLVDIFKSSDNYYEFMLTYPSLSSTLYNRWKQTSSANASTVTGLTKITTAWDNHNYGIRKHASSNAVYDCDTSGTWYAPIGQNLAWSSKLNIPAANNSSQTSTELWIRFDNVENIGSGIKESGDFSIANDFVVCNEIWEI